MEPKMGVKDNNRDPERTNQEEESRENDKTKKLGGIKTVPFILATEAGERFAYLGFHANMISYLTLQLNLPLVKASNIVSNFDGTASLMPFIGALIADSFAGRYWTIILGSILYELGFISITIAALIKSLKPPPCPTQVNCKEASGFQLSILYLSLLLITVGLGGTRPCVVTYAADQLDMTRSAIESRSWNFFNWYFFTVGFSKVAAVTVVIYIQDNVSWGWGLGTPTIAVAIAFLVFLRGSPLYKKVKPQGSPLVRVVQVIVAATRKRKAVAPEDPSLLYTNNELDAAISVHGRLVHSHQFKWLDKAAIVKDGEATRPNPPNLWKLATVHRVEELKSFIRLLPIWASAIFYVAANSHNGSFTTQQARTMNRHLSHSFQIPSASMSVISMLTATIGLPIYERFFVPFARRFTGNPLGITSIQRMGIGFVLHILKTVVSALAEHRRRTAAANHDLLDNPTAIVPISVFWLAPQFFVDGLADIFLSVGQLEFLYDQSPESMRSIAMGLFWATHSMGSYMGTIFVTLVHKYTGHTNNWLPDRNLNRGKLDYYWWLASGIQVINFGYFLICAWFYTYKRLEVAGKTENGDNRNEEVELGKLETVPLLFENSD